MLYYVPGALDFKLIMYHNYYLYSHYQNYYLYSHNHNYYLYSHYHNYYLYSHYHIYYLYSHYHNYYLYSHYHNYYLYSNYQNYYLYSHCHNYYLYSHKRNIVFKYLWRLGLHLRCLESIRFAGDKPPALLREAAIKKSSVLSGPATKAFSPPLSP